MIAYILMFVLAMLAGNHFGSNNRRNVGPILLISIVFIIMMGLRFQVGGDWWGYVNMCRQAEITSIEDWHKVSRDFGFAMLNFVAAESDSGIYGLNLMAGAILVTGVASFAIKQPSPWLVFVAATPYLIIVVGMGYTRQSISLGLCLLAINQLLNDKIIRFIGITLLAALFHKTAIVALPLAVVFPDSRQFWHGGFLVITGGVGAYYLFQSEYQLYWQNYVESEFSSSGAFIRLSMGATAGAVFLLYRKRFQLPPKEERFWSILAFATFVAFAMLPLSSTVADRLALYLTPVQLMVCGRIIYLGSQFQVAVVGAYGGTLIVWLLFANHSKYWIPYQFAPFS